MFKLRKNLNVPLKLAALETNLSLILCLIYHPRGLGRCSPIQGLVVNYSLAKHSSSVWCQKEYFTALHQVGDSLIPHLDWAASDGIPAIANEREQSRISQYFTNSPFFGTKHNPSQNSLLTTLIILHIWSHASSHECLWDCVSVKSPLLTHYYKCLWLNILVRAFRQLWK